MQWRSWIGGRFLPTIWTCNYPHAFLKKRRGYCNRLRPSIRPSVTLSPPKSLEEIQPNSVCELLTWMGCATAHFFGPDPWGPGEGPKGSNIIEYHFSIKKSISKIFKPNIVCLLTNERYKTYQTGFSFGRLGHAPWLGLGGTVGGLGGQKKISRNSARFGVWVTYMNATCNSTIFLGPRPLGHLWGAKRSNIIKSELQSHFQRFLNQTVCIFSRMKVYNISNGIFIRPPGGTLGYRGGWG